MVIMLIIVDDVLLKKHGKEQFVLFADPPNPSISISTISTH